MNNNFRYLDRPLYTILEDRIETLVSAIQDYKPDLLIFLGRTGYARELHYALVNKSVSIIYDFIVEPQAHYYYKDFKSKLNKIMQQLKKFSKEENVNYIPIFNTHNEEFLQTIYNSDYSYILVRVKEKEAINSNELLVSFPLFSDSAEMNDLIRLEIDLRP